MLNQLDQAIVRALQEDFPLEANPYETIASKLGISEEMLLEKIKEFQNKGYIRRIGASLRHRQMGLTANPMIVWHVPDDRVEQVGRMLAAFPEVTHCYQRPMLPKLPFNIYTMIHGETHEGCTVLVEKMAQAVKISDYQLLYSEEELKKTGMRYFLE